MSSLHNPLSLQIDNNTGKTLLQERVYRINGANDLSAPIDIQIEDLESGIGTAATPLGRRENLAQVEVLVLAVILFFAVFGNTVVLVSNEAPNIADMIKKLYMNLI